MYPIFLLGFLSLLVLFLLLCARSMVPSFLPICLAPSSRLCVLCVACADCCGVARAAADATTAGATGGVCLAINDSTLAHHPYHAWCILYVEYSERSRK